MWGRAAGGRSCPFRSGGRAIRDGARSWLWALRPSWPPGRGRPSAFLRRAARSSGLSVIGLLGGPTPRLGYAFSAGAGRFVAYGASALPANRYAPVPNDSAFSDLDYALYLGPSAKPAALLVASARRLPLSGRHTTVTVPFGNTHFTITVAARRSLGGSLPQRLPWAIAIVGTLLSLGAAALTARLIDRRRVAEDLAGRLEEIAAENRRLYGEQRGIAQTLQRALLPQKRPHLPGLQVSARYEAGVDGVEIGGDWYDLIALDEHRLLLVIGDVSGRGLPAATTMASLRYAVRAYAAQGDAPAVLLSKLSGLLNVNADGQIATVLCAMIDAPAYEMTVTNAGHLPALLIRNGRAGRARRGRAARGRRS